MSEQIPQRVWFITGASTGFGRELAEQTLRAGHRVVATARKPEQLSDLARQYKDLCLVLPFDVIDQASVDSGVAAAIEHFGHVDVVVNNAGFGFAGAIEEATEAEYMPVFETNVFGLIRVTKAFLPHLRKRRSGHIVNLSSMAGLVGFAGWGYYNATKFAVNGFSEALALELEPLGIRVTVIEPGPFRTDFLGRSGVEAAVRLSDYDATAGKIRDYRQDQTGKQKGDPVRAIEAIISVVESADPPRHLVLGERALTVFRARLDQWETDLDKYEAITLRTDFPDETELAATPLNQQVSPAK
jgi:NAD(P)-dependent dehydrogenase (short-subunit alcohol dehydrogenase family)